MRRALDLVLNLAVLVGLPGSALAQNPLGKFTDAFEARYSSHQPVLAYTLRVDSTDLSGFAVEIRIRSAKSMRSAVRLMSTVGSRVAWRMASS